MKYGPKVRRVWKDHRDISLWCGEPGRTSIKAFTTVTVSRMQVESFTKSSSRLLLVCVNRKKNFGLCCVVFLLWCSTAKCSSDCPKSTDLVSQIAEKWQSSLRPHMLGISCSYSADEAIHCKCICYNSPNFIRPVVELVYTSELRSDAVRIESSSLSWPIILTVFETVLTK